MKIKINEGSIIKIRPLNEIMKTIKEEKINNKKYLLHKKNNLRFYEELINYCDSKSFRAEIVDDGGNIIILIEGRPFCLHPDWVQVIRPQQ